MTTEMKQSNQFPIDKSSCPTLFLVLVRNRISLLSIEEKENRGNSLTIYKKSYIKVWGFVPS